MRDIPDFRIPRPQTPRLRIHVKARHSNILGFDKRVARRHSGGAGANNQNLYMAARMSDLVSSQSAQGKARKARIASMGQCIPNFTFVAIDLLPFPLDLYFSREKYPLHTA